MAESNLFSYERTIIYLAIITLIEFIIGIIHFEGAWIALWVFALMKAVLIGAVFMHIKDVADRRLLVFAVFIVPLIAGTILILTLINDWRGGKVSA